VLAYLRVPLGWTDVLKRTIKEALADDIFDLAAQQAYYFFFALFPALLFVIRRLRACRASRRRRSCRSSATG
jgi:uncharacterized BrkB/YihY/UPF0761 family membrane protein